MERRGSRAPPQTNQTTSTPPVYYYINNYLLLLALACGGFLLRRPLGLLGAALGLLALLALNDPFAAALK
jgi:hypothetical protein